MIALNRRRVMGGESEIDYSSMYLTFEALESGTFQFTNAANYSLDGGATWVELAAATDTPTLAVGDRIMWKATLTPSSTSGSEGMGTFSSTGEFNAMGNPLSLRSGDSFVGVTTMPNNTYMFARLFYGCTGLINSQNISLPFTTLRNYCYYLMFARCSNMLTHTELPYTGELPTGAYRNMFSYCTSLTTVPTFECGAKNGERVMQAMFYNCTGITRADNITFRKTANLNFYVYAEMFYGCTSLVVPPTELPVETITYQRSYYRMFYGCTSLTYTPNIKVTTLNNATGNQMNEMFRGCSSLTTINMVNITTNSPSGLYYIFAECTSLKTLPTLSIVTNNKSSCLDGAFYGCTSLEDASNLSVSGTGTYCLRDAFRGCTKLTSPPALPATTLSGSNNYQRMFYGCTSLVTAPELPAATLVSNCYNEMFRGCTALNYVKCLATNISASSSHANWLYGVSATGTFVKDANMSDWPSGASGIPSGWTVQDAA